ncbi:MAG: hypothetical protein U0176_13490 [Bacteroidia bacterium]
MGRYAELLNQMAEEHWGHSWMRYTTFTQRDYKKELHSHLGLKQEDLPASRQRFEPQDGLKRLDFLRNLLLKNQTALIKHEAIRKQDFDDLISDINTAEGILTQAIELGEKWFLDVDVE